MKNIMMILLIAFNRPNVCNLSIFVRQFNNFLILDCIVVSIYLSVGVQGAKPPEARTIYTFLQVNEVIF